MCQTCYVGKINRGCYKRCYCHNCNYEGRVLCTDWFYEYPEPLPAMNDNQVESICNLFNAKVNLFQESNMIEKKICTNTNMHFNQYTDNNSSVV